MQLHSRLVPQPNHNQDCKTSNTKKESPIGLSFFVDFWEGQFTFVVFAKNIKASLFKSNGVFVWEGNKTLQLRLWIFLGKIVPLFFINFSVLRTKFMLQFTRDEANFFAQDGVQDDRNQKRHKNLPRQEKEPTQGAGRHQFDLARQRSGVCNWQVRFGQVHLAQPDWRFGLGNGRKHRC